MKPELRLRCNSTLYHAGAERRAACAIPLNMSDFKRASRWWRSETIYQIYPRSFSDHSGDGVGDLEGIRARLPYLRDLGVDALWLSPIFASPMKDFGYDIADYRAIDPLFGTMADFDRLLAEAHEAGLKLLLDLVPNHSSDQHAWFKASRSSREDPKRDWYIWKDAAPDGGPPNNWISNFGGPAWAWDEATGQYYHHAFLASQPDLDWRNPEVRAAMFDAMRFWLDKGVDGFRVDVIWHLAKDEHFRDNPPNPDYTPSQPEIERNLQVHSADQPEIHRIVADMRSVMEEYDERLLIGEIYLPLERLMDYYGEGGSGVHLPFNFQLIQTDWHAQKVAALVAEYEAAIPEDGWPNWVLSNHDQPRIAARTGERQARNAALLLLTLRGTPTLYYGEEIGIGDVEIPPGRIQDPWAKQEPETSRNRDKARTPMQWSSKPHAGFSTTEPWLPLSADWQRRNVAAMTGEGSSMLELHRSLLHLRRQHTALSTGDYRQLSVADDTFTFERCDAQARFAVLLNFASEPREVALHPAYEGGAILFSTDAKRTGAANAPFTLGPDEGVIIQGDPPS